MPTIIKDKEKIVENIFKILAPGQPLRKAIERIQEASLGGLLILSNIEHIEKYIDGGFELDTSFSPQKVYELAKMDGAVLITEDLKTIYGANIQLQPDKEIETEESGTRHRTADRISKLTNKTVITISERRKRITVFNGNFKYTLDLVGDLLIKASQAISSLEKYAGNLNKYLEDLTISEIENTVNLEEVLDGLRYFYFVFKMDKEVSQYMLELGDEARLLQLQHEEIMVNLKNHLLNLIKDYNIKNIKNPEKIVNELLKLEIEDVREMNELANILGYDLKSYSLDEQIFSRGYRLLSNDNKLTKKDVENIVDTFKILSNLLNANYEEIHSVRGMGKFKTERILRLKDKYKNRIF